MGRPQDSAKVLIHVGRELRHQNLTRAPRRSFPALVPRPPLDTKWFTKLSQLLFKNTLFHEPFQRLPSNHVCICMCI